MCWKIHTSISSIIDQNINLTVPFDNIFYSRNDHFFLCYIHLIAILAPFYIKHTNDSAFFSETLNNSKTNT